MLTGSGYSWVATSNGSVPEGALQWGHEPNGDPLYVARIEVEPGEQCVGKLNPIDGAAHFPYDGEKVAEHYEVLVKKT